MGTLSHHVLPIEVESMYEGEKVIFMVSSLMSRLILQRRVALETCDSK